MRVRPLLASSLATALLVGAAYGPVLAVGDPAGVPSSGTAASALSLLDLGVGGHTVRLLELAMQSSAGTGTATSGLRVTPLAADGTAYGEQVVHEAVVLPEVNTAGLAPHALSGLATVRAPRLDVTSDAGAVRAGATDLGDVSLLGLPVRLDGTIDMRSTAGADSAMAGKTVTVTGLALPSLADLLGALGLDLAALPTDTLVGLLDDLALLTPAVTAADKALTDASAAVQAQLDAQQADVDAAAAAVTAKTAELAAAQDVLTGKQSTLSAATAALQPLVAALAVAEAHKAAAETAVTGAQAAVTSAAAAVDGALGLLLPASPLLQALSAAQTALTSAQATLSAATTAVTAASTTLAAAQDAVTLAQAEATAANAVVAALSAAVDGLQGVLDDALLALQSVRTSVAAEVGALVATATGVLDSTPMLSLDRLEVSTRAASTGAGNGAQSAQVVTGRVEGLRVLGTDVLDTVVGTSAVDTGDLAAPAVGAINAAAGQLTGALSQALSTVPGYPGLEVPAPVVQLLNSETSTSAADGFGLAETTLTALTLTWPSLKIPSALALPGAATLPAVAGLPLGVLGGSNLVTAAADLVTQPLSIGLLTVREQARYRAATAGAVVVPPAAGDPTASAVPSAGASSPSAAPTPGEALPTAVPTPSIGPGPSAPVVVRAPGVEEPGNEPGAPVAGPVQPRTPPASLVELPRTGPTSAPALAALLLVAASLGLLRRYGTA